MPMPTVFVCHAAPFLAIDSVKGSDYARWAKAWPKPRAVLVISAHWESRGPLLIGATTTIPLIYDFYGFPPELYELQYPAPGASWLAERIEQLLGQPNTARKEQRGWDHGVWVPFFHFFPKADVPILQISLPRDLTPKQLFEIGKRLAPLRAEDVLIMASGALTHNLRRVQFRDDLPPENWAKEFDDWLASALSNRNYDALFDYRNQAPHAATAHPTDEHFTPLFIAMGAAESDAVSYPIEGFEFQNLSRRCVQFG